MLSYVARSLRGTDCKGVGFAMPNLWLDTHDASGLRGLCIGNDLPLPSMAVRSNPQRTDNHNLMLTG
jgi:hypothetical protein